MRELFNCRWVLLLLPLRRTLTVFLLYLTLLPFHALAQEATTPTPPPTMTLVPQASIESVRYIAGSRMVTVNTRLTTPQAIRNLTVRVYDVERGTLVYTYVSAPINRIRFEVTTIRAERDYQVVMVATGTDGQKLSESTAFLTTRSVTATPSPTREPVEVGLYDIQQREGEWILDIDTINPDPIKAYEVFVIDRETNERLFSVRYDDPPYEELRLPITDLQPGNYQLLLRAYDENGAVLASDIMRQTYAPTSPARATPSVQPAAPAQNIPLPPLFVAGFAAAALLVIRLRRKAAPAPQPPTPMLTRISPPSHFAPTQPHFKPSVFISYRRRPSALLATLICKELRARGFEVFLDTEQADGAGSFPSRLHDAIATHDVFVCLLADSTFESEWVMHEIQQAHTLEKPMIPVFQESYVPVKKAPSPHVASLLNCDGIHILDIRNIYIDEAIERLAAMLVRTRWQRAAHKAG